MHLRQLVYCAVLIGIFSVFAKAVPPSWCDLWQKFLSGLSALARHKTWSCVALGVMVLAVRAVLLPIWPIPKPTIYDEFSYLLQADTFAHGRLTNPAHPLWQFFESIYIVQQPTYASRFPPGQGLALAIGQLLFGHPWFGVWLSAGLLAAALCWALQGWLPSGWALLGAFIGFELCLFSYWMNSYWGGAVAAIGGALVIGAWVRIVRAKQWRYAWLFGIGAVIVILARPFEGLLLVDCRFRRPNCYRPIAAYLHSSLSTLCDRWCSSSLSAWRNCSFISRSKTGCGHALSGCGRLVARIT
jgi:hypothetical protein